MITVSPDENATDTHNLSRPPGIFDRQACTQQGVPPGSIFTAEDVAFFVEMNETNASEVQQHHLERAQEIANLDCPRDWKIFLLVCAHTSDPGCA